MTPDRSLRRAVPLGATVIVALVAASGGFFCEATASAAAAAGETGRIIHLSLARDGEPIVCVEPRPACTAGSAACLKEPAATAEVLRRGLFEICEGYRAGKLSAEAYRESLAAYPSLVAQMAALDRLGPPAPGGRESADTQTMKGWLVSNPALPALCRSISLNGHPAAAITVSPHLAGACLSANHWNAKE